MTREEARKAAEVMLAYADGKEIEVKMGDKWVSSYKVSFNWFDFEYRVKPEPKYRPFEDADECWQEMLKHQPFGWIQDKNNSDFKMCILSVDNDGVLVGDFGDCTTFMLYESLFKYNTFIDGSLIGME